MIFSDIIVTVFFPLFRHHYVLHDKDGDAWLFQERLNNGLYPRYTLVGETLSKGIRHTAFLYCNFKCDFKRKRISVFIEDIIVAKKGKHLGTWMLNRLIDLIRQAGGTIQFDEIYGDFKANDEKQALAFFSRFGFQPRQLPSGRERISCPVEELHQVGTGDLKEIGYQEIVREWHAAKFGVTR